MLYPFKILNKKKYTLCFINALLENLCIYCIPLVLSIFLSEPFTLTKFTGLIVCTLALEALKITCNILWNVKASPFIETSKKDLQIAYFQRITNMSMASLNNTHTGYLKKQLDVISEATVNLLEEIMMTVNGFVIALVIFLVQVWLQSILMFFICCLFITVIVIYNLAISKKNIQVQQKYNDENAKFNATGVDFLQNVKIVKNADAYDYATTTIQNQFETVKKPLKQAHVFHSLRIDGINVMMYALYALILISLFIKMQQGAYVFNYIVFYSTIFGGLRGELKGIARLFLQFNKFKSANTQLEKMIVATKAPDKIYDWQQISLRDLHFMYDDETKQAIHITDFTINKTDKISIVGESGQGKTTLLNLFCRFYAVAAENYLIDQNPTEQVPDVAYISQETELFDLSIKDNLCLGKKLPDDVLRSYFVAAGLSDWLDNLENGWDTIVGEKGVKLSAGQKQRLNIIRGIILDKDVYILDEPTANLDSVSEAKICHMIKTYLQDKTCIIVTHRPKLTEFCNKHYLFQNKTLQLID